MIISNDKKDQNLKINERETVEEPFLQQLEDQGWEIIDLRQHQEPKDSFRENFRQVVLVPKLEEALRKINTFLENDQISEILFNYFSGHEATEAERLFVSKNLKLRDVREFWANW